jgi:hypothetical protein
LAVQCSWKSKTSTHMKPIEGIPYQNLSEGLYDLNSIWVTWWWENINDTLLTTDIDIQR